MWVSDIACIPTDEDWLYLVGVKDLFNGELMDYAMSQKMTKSLAIQAIFRATASKHLNKRLSLINEHVEPVFNTATVAQIVFQRPVRPVDSIFDSTPKEVA